MLLQKVATQLSRGGEITLDWAPKLVDVGVLVGQSGVRNKCLEFAEKLGKLRNRFCIPPVIADPPP